MILPDRINFPGGPANFLRLKRLTFRSLQIYFSVLTFTDAVSAATYTAVTALIFTTLGEMNAKLLEKVEELTLYLLRQSEKLKAQQELIERQQNRIEAIEKSLNN